MTDKSDITIDSGVVRGVRGRQVSRWRSIPYAAAPVGQLRLRAPQPVPGWDGIRDATQFGYAAIQHRAGAQLAPRRFQPMSEDALTLNVTAPNGNCDKLRPVMVFIHGGGYLFGTSALDLYSGARLAQTGDVVVVSLNYRLGAFGYVDFSEFSTTARKFDSNIGLRDQVAALEWVRRNISAFGGDPDNVTIFGESAGGNAITTLLATPAAHGLFHQAIAESSPADWVLPQAEAHEFARRSLRELGATPETAASMLAEAPAQELRRAAARAMIAVMQESPGLIPLCPVVDGDYLPVAPLEAIAAGSAAAVPLIIGTNRDEATLFTRFADQLPTNAERLERLFSQAGADVKKRVTAAYPEYPAVGAAVHIGGDYVFWRPTIAVLEAHSGHAPTYAYRFDFTTRTLRLMGLGATHALELFAVFGAADTMLGRALTGLGDRSSLLAVTKEVQDNWIQFAHTGSPLPEWPQYSRHRRVTMIFNRHSRLEDDPGRERRLAWQGVGFPSLVKAQ